MPRPPSGNVRISLHVEPRHVQMLDLLSKYTHQKRAVLIRDAIDHYTRHLLDSHRRRTAKKEDP